MTLTVLPMFSLVQTIILGAPTTLSNAYKSTTP